MPYQELLTPARVAWADAGDRAGVLARAADLLSDGDTARADAIRDALEQRERLGSTGIGHGVALPHGRGGVQAARGAFLRLVQPVDFGAADDVAVDLVFAMLVPEGFNQLHLEWLSELAGLFADDASS